MQFKLLIPLLFAGAALAACSSFSSSTPADTEASTEARAAPEDEAAVVVLEEEVVVTEPQAEPTEGDDLPAADTGWAKTGVTQEQHRADIESCYHYAWSQVQRDLNIDSDIDSARFDQDDGLGFNQLTAQMDAYNAGNRRSSLMRSCMEAKGYVRT